MDKKRRQSTKDETEVKPPVDREPTRATDEEVDLLLKCLNDGGLMVVVLEPKITVH